MSKILKSYEVTLKFRLNVNEISEEDIPTPRADDDVKEDIRNLNLLLNQEMQRAFLEHPEVESRLLPAMIGETVEAYAGDVGYAIVNPEKYQLRDIDNELVQFVSEPARAWGNLLDDPLALESAIHPYLESFELVGVSSDFREVKPE